MNLAGGRFNNGGKAVMGAGIANVAQWEGVIVLSGVGQIGRQLVAGARFGFGGSLILACLVEVALDHRNGLRWVPRQCFGGEPEKMG